MNKLDILGSNLLNLPLKSNEEDFLDFIIKINSEYIDLVRKLNDQSVFDNVVRMTKAIESTISYTYKGMSNKAYEVMSTMLNEIELELINLNSELSQPYNQTYYRIRKLEPTKKKSTKEWKLEDNFHLPFELRHIAKNQRYSISGYPCLYLARTIYTCWEEFDRPQVNEFIASRYEIPVDYNLLYLSYLPYQLKHEYHKEARRSNLKIDQFIKEKEEYLNSYLMMIPLIIASSIRRKNDDAIFHAEYIIPQIITQWVRNNSKFDGILYFSTKTYTKSKKNSSLYENLVIPVKTFEKQGFCKEMADDIKMTVPVTFSDIKNQKYFNIDEINKCQHYNIGEIIRDYNNSNYIKYCESDLHEFEKLLSLLPLNTITC
ncbi:RES domain-containing protein [Wukongibacter baidiensis]|uniref:hypothetical protein n=1 Tax=Wukongibacter baidiensis TaxID=1723361 RepID=UPI003D7FC4F7